MCLSLLFVKMLFGTWSSVADQNLISSSPFVFQVSGSFHLVVVKPCHNNDTRNCIHTYRVVGFILDSLILKFSSLNSQFWDRCYFTRPIVCEIYKSVICHFWYGAIMKYSDRLVKNVIRFKTSTEYTIHIFKLVSTYDHPCITDCQPSQKWSHRIHPLKIKIVS